MFLISCYRFSVHFQFYFSVFTGFLILKMPFSVFQASILRFKCHKVSCNVLRLALSGVAPTPSHYKYNKTIKLNNCAIEDFPQAQPLMQTAVVCSFFITLISFSNIFVKFFNTTI